MWPKWPDRAAIAQGRSRSLATVLKLSPCADSASKAALHSATETLRMEVAGFGLDVMLVAPGAITSQFGKKQSASIKLPAGERSVLAFHRPRAVQHPSSRAPSPVQTPSTGMWLNASPSGRTCHSELVDMLSLPRSRPTVVNRTAHRPHNAGLKARARHCCARVALSTGPLLLRRREGTALLDPRARPKTDRLVLALQVTRCRPGGQGEASVNARLLVTFGIRLTVVKDVWSDFQLGSSVCFSTRGILCKCLYAEGEERGGVGGSNLRLGKSSLAGADTGASLDAKEDGDQERDEGEDGANPAA